MASDLVSELTDDTFDAAITGASTPVLVDFWAPWCGPCRMIAPVVDEIAAERSGSLKVAKVNVDDCGQTAAKYGIQSIPALFIFKDGEKKAEIIGVTSKANILAKIDAA